MSAAKRGEQQELPCQKRDPGFGGAAQICPKFLDKGPVTVLPDCLRSNQASLRHAETAGKTVTGPPSTNLVIFREIWGFLKRFLPWQRQLRLISAVQQSSVKVQLLVVHHELAVPVESAWSTRQVFAHIEQEARRQYPTEQYVTGGVKFPDGRFEHESQLQSGSAFAQQQAKICLLPRANNQPPLMNQFKQLLTDQESRLESSFDKKLETMKEKQDEVTAFTAKPVLLRLASDILSMTLSAVRPDLRRGATDNIWDQPSNRHQSFATTFSVVSTTALPLERVYNSCGFQWHQIEQECFEQYLHLQTFMLVVKNSFVQVETRVLCYW